MITIKPYFFIFALFFPGLAHSQINAKENLKDSVHFKGRYKGNIRYVYQWQDRYGENSLLLTLTDEIPSKAKKSGYNEDCDGCTDIEIYAYHFIGRDSLLWKVQDFERACNWDNVVDFRRNSIRFTDLDSNNIAEVWLMYSMACASDVSPSVLKLIMYQGSLKAAIRGTSQPSRRMPDRVYGGKYVPDRQFLSLPLQLRKFGEKLWSENLYDLE